MKRIYILCSVVLLIINCGFALELPRVSLHESLTLEELEIYWTPNKTKTERYGYPTPVIKEKNGDLTLAIPSRYYVTILSCNGSYPVEWTSSLEKKVYYGFRTRTYRKTTNVNDVSTYSYTSFLILEGGSVQFSGTYSCHSVSSPEFKREVSIFLLPHEGSSTLINAGEMLSVKSKDDGKTLVLPCGISNPDPEIERQLSLFKLNISDYEKIERNSSITYDHLRGFILNLNEMKTGYGSYKCLIGDDVDENNDVVYIHALKGKKVDFNDKTDILKGSASFSFNKNTSEFVCCSNSPKPPVIITAYCLSPSDCVSRKSELYDSVIYSIHMRNRNGSCTSQKSYPRDTGLVRCKGDGIDIVRNYFTSFNEEKAEDYETTHRMIHSIYYNVNEVEPEKMMGVSLSPMHRDITDYETIEFHTYLGETIMLYCDTSQYFFSSGIKWSIKYKNDTENFIYKEESGFVYFGSEPEGHMELTPTIDMESATCHAPIWNTTGWGRQEIKLNMTQSHAPKIDGETVDITWTLNSTEKILYCNSSGTPSPHLVWIKSGGRVVNTPNIKTRRENGSTSLKVMRVSHDIQGTYVCTAKNIAGSAKKTFNVYVVEAATSSWSGLTIFFITLIIGILIAGLGILIWKMKLQNKIIDHLTGVVFKDVGT